MVPSMTERSEWQTPAASIGDLDLVRTRPADLEVVGDLHPFARVDDASHDLLLSIGHHAVRTGSRDASRSSRFRTFPLALTGRASTSTMPRGTL